MQRYNKPVQGKSDVCDHAIKKISQALVELEEPCDNICNFLLIQDDPNTRGGGWEGKALFATANEYQLF